MRERKERSEGKRWSGARFSVAFALLVAPAVELTGCKLLVNLVRELCLSVHHPSGVVDIPASYLSGIVMDGWRGRCRIDERRRERGRYSTICGGYARGGTDFELSPLLLLCCKLSRYPGCIGTINEHR